MKVLVFVEQRARKIKSSALEALTVGARLAGSSADCAAVLVGSFGGAAESLATQLKGHGADTVFVFDQAAAEHYNPDVYAAAVEAAIKKHGAQVVVGLTAPMSRDLFPKLAARLDAAILTDLTSIENQGGQLTGVKPMYAGKALAKVAVTGGSLTFASLRPNSVKAEQSGQGAAKVTPLEAAMPTASRSKTAAVRAGASEKVDLTEAARIVSGGRALGSADNFKVLNELAAVLSATVGASRAAVDAGYASHDMQVGQTGKTVNPNLYVACGISGSIQHMAGMRTSKTIVAINTDPEAPIFKVASYGIVADLFKAVPVMTQKVKQLLDK